MWLIVGLGNPGAKYALTRHNIGFMAVDFLHRSLSAPNPKSDFKALVNRFKWQDQEIVTLQPQTFMNLSGDSVRAAMDFYKIPLEKLVVIHDEIDQPFAKLKIQKNRGHGGHNGIRDITAKMSSMDYGRLRLGVGRPENPQFAVADYVLQRFSDSEMAELPKFLNHSVDAIEAIITKGLPAAANTFNQDPR